VLAAALDGITVAYSDMDAVACVMLRVFSVPFSIVCRLRISSDAHAYAAAASVMAVLHALNSDRSFTFLLGLYHQLSHA